MARRAALPVLFLIVMAAVIVACGSPPQVLEISPARGAADVRSSEVIRIRFDRAMDRPSVGARFRVEPRAQGTLRWASDSELMFEHAPFNPSSRYQVVLDPGYRDASGTANSLRHSWTFRTETAPGLTGSTPGPGDGQVDPAAYIALTFSRELDPSSLSGAVSLSPETSFAMRLDPTDARRLILAPQSLLLPRTGYRVAVGTDARDVDGNRLGGDAVVSFTTGAFRPLRHWIGFIAETPASTGATSTSAGVWIVDENRFPRRLVDRPVSSFSWSADGSHLLVRSPEGTWTDQALDGTPGTTLPFHAEWADFLAGGHGYAFLDQGRLQVLQPDGAVVLVSTGVTEAAVAPGGGRLAFVVRDPSGAERATEIDGYDTALRARYRLQSETDLIDALSWSPDGQGIAYRLDTGDAARRQVRALSLRDGNTVTVATGVVSAPTWQADRQHVLFIATVPTPGGLATRIFRAAVGGGPAALSVSTGMPAAQDVDVVSLSTSADGHQLAFISDVGGRLGLWAMNADGTGVTQLTDPDADRFPYSCLAVAWTPS